jgi:hypothetical protein
LTPLDFLGSSTSIDTQHASWCFQSYCGMLGTTSWYGRRESWAVLHMLHDSNTHNISSIH